MQWYASRAGTYTLDLMVNDEYASRARSISVRPSNLPSNASMCKADGPGTTSAIVGERNSFVVSTYDAYGNARQSNGDTIEVHAQKA